MVKIKKAFRTLILSTSFKFYLLLLLSGLCGAISATAWSAAEDRVFKEIPAGVQLPFKAVEDESEKRYPHGVVFEKDIVEKMDIDYLVDRAPVIEPERKKIQVKFGLLEQASLFPNPAFEWKPKRLPGDFNLGERTDEFLISQKFELGGKRHYRMKVGEKEVDEAIEGFYYRRAVFKNEVTKLFNNIYYLQKRLEKEKEVLSLIGKMRELAKTKLVFGKISGKDFIDYEVSYRKKTVKVETLTKEIEQNLRFFEEKVGLNPGTIKSVNGVLPELESLPREIDLAKELLEKNPEINLLRRKVETARQKLEREKYLFIPDITLKATMLSDRARNQDTYGLEMMVPIPLFDRNQGGIMAAEASLEQAQKELHAERSGLLGSSAKHMTSYENAFKNLEKYSREILPLAEETRRFFNIAYEAGRISMLENIGAQVQVLEAEIEKMEFQVRAQNLLQDIFFLAGRVY
ncbi:MAG: TolC family protein [Nitrospira sp.]|nr:TolC family protein [Nitrospira sp.]